ncbi:ABC transporter permease [Clostridium sp. 'deep sea']|uniref:ABC transporter permease n=1 Tax=Clostridium sp. 'deep sea' TaxID=2779445 RepID=UPI0018964A74|nr:ABC transporter permease [Clostridium sp. 'deep sea']QOR35087.1 ABC transporter permease [Clostridium sp. 'deep sea']
MQNILCITKKNFIQLFRKKLNIFVYLVLPILITSVIFGITAKSNVYKYTMGVIDKDNSQISRDMLSYLEKTNKFALIPIEDSEVEEKVVSRNLSFVFSIPKGFADSIKKGVKQNVEVVSIQGQQTTIFIKQFANMYINNLNDIYKASGGNTETFNKIYKSFQEGEFTYNTTYIKDKSITKSSTEISMGLFIMIVLVAASTTSSMLLEEKRNKTYYRISTAPVKPFQIVFANVLVNILIITIQICFVLLMITKVFGVNVYVPVLQLFIILFTFGFAAIGIGMMIMAFSKSSATAGLLGTLIITPSCMLAGCFWPRSIMPKMLQKVSLFIPHSWAMDSINKIQMGKSFADIRINIVITLLFAVVFFLIVAYKIKRANENDEFI